MITEMSRDSIKSTGTSNPVPVAVVDASSKEGASQTPSSETLGEVRMVLPEIAEEQRRDPYYSDVIRFMENGVLPEDEKVARRMVLSCPSLDLIDSVHCFVESRPFEGPYRVISATENTVQVRPVGKPDDHAEWLNMERVRFCPGEIPDIPCVGKSTRRRKKRH